MIYIAVSIHRRSHDSYHRHYARGVDALELIHIAWWHTLCAVEMGFLQNFLHFRIVHVYIYIYIYICIYSSIYHIYVCVYVYVYRLPHHEYWHLNTCVRYSLHASEFVLVTSTTFTLNYARTCSLYTYIHVHTQNVLVYVNVQSLSYTYARTCVYQNNDTINVLGVRHSQRSILMYTRTTIRSLYLVYVTAR
jgi:hypothetical protein